MREPVDFDDYCMEHMDAEITDVSVHNKLISVYEESWREQKADRTKFILIETLFGALILAVIVIAVLLQYFTIFSLVIEFFLGIVLVVLVGFGRGIYDTHRTICVDREFRCYKGIVTEKSISRIDVPGRNVEMPVLKVNGVRVGALSADMFDALHENTEVYVISTASGNTYKAFCVPVEIVERVEIDE